LDFFEQQERSRASSRWFLVWYVAAALAVIASYCLAGALVYAFLATAGALPVAGEPLAWRGFGRTYLDAFLRVPLGFHAAVAALVGVPMLAVTAARMWRLREGGPAIADLLGARYVDSAGCPESERRLLNIVQEMAVASGIAVPPAYVLEREQGVNAMVAGYSPNEAVIIVTRGAVEKLTRDELQGVVAHEFSHILNGDMALNMFLAGWLAGLTWLGTKGEELAMASMVAPEEGVDVRPAGNPLGMLFGTFLAFVGFPGRLVADAIRARIAREREMLADAASVQFTRNPEGIAGALDSLLSLPAYTTVSAAYSVEFAHMFFAPAVSRWWGSATHPNIAERIRHVDPRFRAEDYRARRYGRSRDVAVLDDLGNVVKQVHTLPRDSVGRPTAQHVDFAARLLARLPQSLCEALREPRGAELAMFALAVQPDQREASLAFIERKRGMQDARDAADLHIVVGALARQHLLTLAGLAIPVIKSQPQAARDRFLADLAQLVELDGRVTLREFVLFTLLRQRLREGAGLPIATQFRSIDEVAPDARAVLSLVALPAGEGAPQAFQRGAAVVRLKWDRPLPPADLNTALLGAALERLRRLAPFEKPALLKACCETAGADGRLTLAEAEVVRTVAATLDCPVPPMLSELDPLALAA
jgi:Zn-dependent protease with chaperone function